MLSKLWGTLEKKNHTYYEQDPEKVALFLKNFNSLKHLASVYIDEQDLILILSRIWSLITRPANKIWKKISEDFFDCRA